MNFLPVRRRFLLPALAAPTALTLLAFTTPIAAAAPAGHTNRLAREKSPYLLQHQHNPVDWFPWGEEAFAKARAENKPVFLSVGYSTCHWCHVMERESFENPAIAKLLNERFVAIKVDREERPDVDANYLAFVQATTGGGGWPMSVFLTPDLKPFIGGTYFPPEDRGGQPGLKTILPEIADAWRQHAPEIRGQADQILGQLRKFTAVSQDDPGEAAAPDHALLDAAYAQLAGSFDAENGGFGDAPKFPRPVTLNLLTRLHARAEPGSPEAKKALEMDLVTLRHMAAGGLHDHLGGGFHRYSTDARWHVPHFEKMLYDQAQLAIAYLEVYQITGDETLAETARDILGYVRRDLTDPASGGFLSAEDADSQPRADQAERVEGAFYVWTQAEFDRCLGQEDAAVFKFFYGVEANGNVPARSDAHGELKGKNVLDATGSSLEEVATKFKRSVEQVRAGLARSREKLLALRVARPRPRRDDKIITAWNGLAISAFARAYQVLGDPGDLAAAQRAAAFLAAQLFDATTGRLTRSYRQGASEAAGFAEDYAFLIQGLLDLYEADFQPDHLRWAEALQKTQDALFWDEATGGYFDTAGTDPHLLLRAKGDHDGAEPSANAVAALNLARLGQMLENDADRKRSAQVSQAFGGTLRRAPLALPQMLVALDFQLGPTRQIVIAGRAEAPDTAAMLRAARQPFLPRRVFLFADGAAGQEFLGGRVEFLKDVRPLEGKATAYVCQNFACQLPTNEVSVMQALLRRGTPATTR